ncbi:MAG TPA: hypothetical protein VF476_02950, partial [Chitinophagaceae bacterium]
MTGQTFHFLLRQDINWDLAAFIFFATLCSYSFHWYLTTGSVIPSERMNWLQQHRNLYIFIFTVALAGACFFFLRIVAYWPWLTISALATFLYSAPKIPHPYFRLLRRVAVGKTIFLAFVWMYVTTILPIIVSGKPWNNSFSLFIIS